MKDLKVFEHAMRNALYAVMLQVMWKSIICYHDSMLC